VFSDQTNDATTSAGTDAPGRVRDGHPVRVDRDWTTLDHQARTALEGNPYLRSALTGQQPDEHAGLPKELAP